MNKLFIVLTAALLLGGCTLGAKMIGKSATDTSSPTPTSPLSTTLPDSELDSMPSTTTSNDTSSIESDLNATVILDEDFSDLD